MCKTVEFRETQELIRLDYRIVSHTDQLLLEKQHFTEPNLSRLLKLLNYLKTYGLTVKPGRRRRDA